MSRCQTPSFDNFFGNIVRIISYNVQFNWTMPFNTNNPSKTVGSGFFFDAEGHILTCSHVVDSTNKHLYIEIPSEGSHQYKVTVVGICPFFDIAVLKVKNYKNPSYCSLDTKTDIKVGMETYAIGYPLGQDNLKFTKGIISGQQYNFVQTDASINPGNSGGPLVYNNKVVGINAAGVPAGEAEGIGYAIPISRFLLVKPYFLKRRSGGSKLLHYPEYFGFENMQNTSADMSAFMRSECASGGVYINGIIPKSPVSKTKLKTGDVVCRINDIQIDSYGKLQSKWMNENITMLNMLSVVGLDKKIKINYWNGEKMVVERFAMTTFAPVIRETYPMYEKIDYECIGGLILMMLNKNIIETLKNHELLKYLQIENIMDKCLVITNVLVGSSVYKMNVLTAGDVVHSVNDVKVHTLNDFRKAYRKDNKFLKLETTQQKVMVVSKPTLMRDDALLQKTYQYKPSQLILKKRTRQK